MGAACIAHRRRDELLRAAALLHHRLPPQRHHVAAGGDAAPKLGFNNSVFNATTRERTRPNAIRFPLEYVYYDFLALLSAGCASRAADERDRPDRRTLRTRNAVLGRRSAYLASTARFAASGACVCAARCWWRELQAEAPNQTVLLHHALLVREGAAAAAAPDRPARGAAPRVRVAQQRRPTARTPRCARCRATATTGIARRMYAQQYNLLDANSTLPDARCHTRDAHPIRFYWRHTAGRCFVSAHMQAHEHLR